MKMYLPNQAVVKMFHNVRRVRSIIQYWLPIIIQIPVELRQIMTVNRHIWFTLNMNMNKW